MGRTLPCRALERCVPRCRWELQGPDRCVEGQAGPGVCGHKGGEWGLRGSEVGTGRASSEAFRGPPHLVWGDSEGTNGRDQSGGPHVIQGFAPEVDAQRGGRAEAGGCPRVHWACPLLPRGHWPRHGVWALQVTAGTQGFWLNLSQSSAESAESSPKPARAAAVFLGLTQGCWKLEARAVPREQEDPTLPPGILL